MCSGELRTLVKLTIASALLQGRAASAQPLDGLLAVTLFEQTRELKHPLGALWLRPLLYAS